MRRRRWSAQEIQILQDHYYNEGSNQIAQFLGRSVDSVSSFARRCGIRTRRWLERQESKMFSPNISEPSPVPDHCSKH